MIWFLFIYYNKISLNDIVSLLFVSKDSIQKICATSLSNLQRNSEGSAIVFTPDQWNFTREMTMNIVQDLYIKPEIISFTKTQY